METAAGVNITVEAPARDAMLACCALNGGDMCLYVEFQLPLAPLAVADDGTPPQPKVLAATEDHPLPRALIAATAERFNGHMELRSVLVSPSDDVDAAGDGIHLSGRIVLMDGGAEQSWTLGPLQSASSVVSAILLDHFPTTVRFEVLQTAAPVLHPSELLLAQHCYDLLCNDEFSGSVSSSHLQNQVRELPSYAAVVGVTKPSWSDFVTYHADAGRWRIFKFTQEEIDENQLSSTCRSKEQRLYPAKHEAVFRQGDIARDRVRQRSEAELSAVLLRELESGPLEQSELLSRIIDQKCFLTLITPNITKIIGMFEAAPDRYFILNDACHPLIIERRRAVEPTSATIWNAAEQQQRNPQGTALVFDRVTRRMVERVTDEGAPSTKAKSVAETEPDSAATSAAAAW